MHDASYVHLTPKEADMWLLNTSTQKLKSFPDNRSVSYAILSHHWVAGEVLFDDVQAATSASRGKAGWIKLERTCAQARIDGHQWVWIDTCCINKHSSAELSEAINSMYHWHQSAAVCYAYLSDVVHSSDFDVASALDHSVWFTRGWTLQELIAPQRVEFYSSNWKRLGTREDLQPTLTRITGIPGDLLAGTTLVEEYSVAQRMSWAAHRKSTRVEDVAYSLMGLFRVYMPLLYGEGEAAFVRLQEEIMKDSADETIFAWTYRNASKYHGLLAQSPADFVDCGRIRCPEESIHRDYSQKTNRGLRITLYVRPHSTNVYHAALDCVESGENERIGIFLGCPATAVDTAICARRLFEGQDRLTFQMQQRPGDPDQEGDPFLKPFMIPPRPFPGARVQDIHFGFVVSGFDIGPEISLGQVTRIVARPGTWDPALGILTLPPGTTGTAMCFAMYRKHKNDWWIIAKLGFSQSFTPIFMFESVEAFFFPNRGKKLNFGHGRIRRKDVPAILAEPLTPSKSRGCFQANCKDGLMFRSKKLELFMAIDDHHDLGLAWHVRVKYSDPEIKPSEWIVDYDPFLADILGEDYLKR